MTTFTLSKQDTLYPMLLRSCRDAPEQVYGQGKAALFSRPAISVIGSRKMTGYGKGVLDRFIPVLAKAGLVIVSGLAYGVDSYAHQVALKCGAACLAVLAGPLDQVYPAAHLSLFRHILEEGGLAVSEYPENTPVQKHFFPLRNRLVAGLSQVTLIIEAGEQSGTLITARYALDYGREVCVIPADITRPQSQGVLRLLKEGAVRPVTTPEELLAAYQLPLPLVAKEPLQPALTGSPATLYDCISNGIDQTERLVSATGWTVAQLQSVLSVLELDGYIVRKGHSWQKI